MRALFALLMLLLAGCTDPGADPMHEAPSDAVDDHPVSEEWHLSVEDGHGVLVPSRPADTRIGGGCCMLLEGRIGPFIAVEESAGFLAESLGNMTITWASQNPGPHEFRLFVYDEHGLVAHGGFEEMHVGTFFPVPFIMTTTFDLTLERSVPAGATLEAWMEVDGSLLWAWGRGGDWPTYFTFTEAT